ncbi:6-phospho-3-hexuloisomerase [Scopulibacillus cellulosilyticus]|uniref:6-phospho-3-hexuloisomerase n=1 Tax=Scopulibacillus cellulosilyticus TaxID=2665665 RepID=A0ABW2PYX0_9BACL
MSDIKTILKEIESVLNRLDEGQLEDTAKELYESKRIFVVGEGRSGLMAKSFAMRLMHLGAQVYVVGETITPSIQQDDTLVAVSGSGKTKQVVWTAEKARTLGCQVIAVTANPESDLANAASRVVHVPAATKYRSQGEAASIQPLGSLFDQCAHLLFDTICLKYSGLSENGQDQAFARHSNLE